MKKMIIFGVVIGIFITGVSIIFLKNKRENELYKVVASIVEKNSPDRKIEVLKNEKIIEFDSIYYLDNVFICDNKNPTVGKTALININKLKVKLKNGKYIIARLEKEE